MNDSKTISLTELLAQNAERVLSRLIEDLMKKGDSRYRQLPPDVLRARIQRLFDAFWQGIAQNDSKPLTQYIRSTSRERANEGVTVADLQAVGVHLRNALLEVVDEAYADDAELRLRYSRQIEELILSGIGSGVQGFVDGREALIARQFEALMRRRKKGDAEPGRNGP